MFLCSAKPEYIRKVTWNVDNIKRIYIIKTNILNLDKAFPKPEKLTSLNRHTVILLELNCSPSQTSISDANMPLIKAPLSLEKLQ